MKGLDISEFASHVFGGLMLGIIIGGYAGKTIPWMFIGGVVCGGFWATNYISDHLRKEKKDH